MSYENQALMDLCRGRDCYLAIPDVCCFNRETVVPCHANLSAAGKGMGMKASSTHTVPGCFTCHKELDSGKTLSREEKEHYWRRAFDRWIEAIFREGLVVVAGSKPKRERLYQPPSKIIPRGNRIV